MEAGRKLFLPIPSEPEARTGESPTVGASRDRRVKAEGLLEPISGAVCKPQRKMSGTAEHIRLMGVLPVGRFSFYSGHGPCSAALLFGE